MKQIRLLIASAALVLFLIADNWRSVLKFFAPQFFAGLIQASTWKNRLELQATIWLGVAALGIFFVHRLSFKAILQELGLHGSFSRGVVFAALATVPMSLGFAMTSKLNPEASLSGIFLLAIVSPFAEEVLYRGYLFRQLHQRAGLSFVLAAVLTALFFGLGHFSDAAREGGLWNGIGVVAITGLGGAIFAWLFVRWEYNLWIPFGMHALMNLWWELFAVDTTALGGWLANVVRLLSVAIAILLTVYRGRIWKPKVI